MFPEVPVHTCFQHSLPQYRLDILSKQPDIELLKARWVEV